MIGRYTLAVIVAFVSSMAAVFVLAPLWLSCDNVSGWPQFLAACLVGFSIALVGVVCGTIMLPRSEWKIGSQRLWIFGMVFSILLIMTWFLVPGLFLGGLVAWRTFRWLDGKPADRVPGLLVFTAVAVIFVCSIIVLKTVGGLNAMTKERADKLIAEAGGIETVQGEAAAIFSQMKTSNNVAYFHWYTEKTNFPALNKLGKWVGYQGAQNDLPEYLVVRYGGHFHGGFYTIYPRDFDTNKITPSALTKFQELANRGFQLTNNIVVVEFSH